MAKNWMPITGSFAVTANELLARRGGGEWDDVDVGSRLVDRLRTLADAGCGDERLVLHVRALPPREGGTRAIVSLDFAKGGKAREVLLNSPGANALFADRAISDLCIALERMLTEEYIEDEPAFTALFAMEGLGYGLSRASIVMDEDKLGSGGVVKIDDADVRAVYDAITRGFAAGGLEGIPDEMPVGPHLGLDTRGLLCARSGARRRGATRGRRRLWL